MGEEKRTEPFCGGILCRLKKERVKYSVKETSKRADHYQDFKTNNKIKHYSTAQYSPVPISFKALIYIMSLFFLSQNTSSCPLI